MTVVVGRELATYRATSEADGVEFIFEHIRNGKDSLTAETTVLTTLPGFGPVLVGPKLFNLLAERTQKDWGKTLSDRCPEVRDWDGLLTEVCRETLKVIRSGEPSVRLADVPRPESGSWLLNGLVLSRLPVVLFGDGSAGKSLLALALAETIQRGEGRILGLEPNARANVLWLDWEFDGWEHRLRSEAFCQSPSDIRYRRCSGPLADQVEAISKEINEHDIGHLVVDSAAYACGGKPEDSEQTNRMFDALRFLDRGTTIIAHETKFQSGQIQLHEKPFGSVFWHNAARATWFVQKQQDEQDMSGTSTLHIGLFNKKSNAGRLWKPFGFMVEIKTNDQDEMVSCRFEREDVRDIEGLRKSTPIRSRILHLLGTGRYAVATIAREIEEKEETVRRTLIRMEKAKQVVVVDSVNNVQVYGLRSDHIDLEDIPF